MSLSHSASRLIGFLELRTEGVLLVILRLYFWSVFYGASRAELAPFLSFTGWKAQSFPLTDIAPLYSLPPEHFSLITATLATLLLVGFLGRVCAFGLLLLLSTLEYQQLANDAAHTLPHLHACWALLLLVIMVRGSGVFSLDFFTRKKMIL